MVCKLLNVEEKYPCAKECHLFKNCFTDFLKQKKDESKDAVWFIQSDNGFWNTKYGWVEDMGLMTLFKDKEKKVFTLPMGKKVEWNRYC